MERKKPLINEVLLMTILLLSLAHMAVHSVLYKRWVPIKMIKPEQQLNNRLFNQYLLFTHPKREHTVQYPFLMFLFYVSRFVFVSLSHPITTFFLLFSLVRSLYWWSVCVCLFSQVLIKIKHRTYLFAQMSMTAAMTTTTCAIHFIRSYDMKKKQQMN